MNTNKPLAHFKTVQASAIKQMVEVLHSVLNDVNFCFSPEGVKVLTLDSSKTALVHVNLDADSFEEYSCEKYVTAGMNMTNLYKLLKSITNNDVVTLDVISEERMDVKIENETKKSKTTFSMKLLELPEDVLESPSAQLDIVTTIPSIDFQRLCRDMSNLTREIQIEREGKTLTMSCEGDFANQSTTIECSEDNCGGKSVKDKYSLQFVVLFTKATALCSSVQVIQGETGMPILFKYKHC